MIEVILIEMSSSCLGYWKSWIQAVYLKNINLYDFEYFYVMDLIDHDFKKSEQYNSIPPHLSNILNIVFIVEHNTRKLDV